jgi:2-keto-4-pentenoate hydratase/2-oxohepta-3-ene-1,7-dioic acid hydratase in catechol pathway
MKIICIGRNYANHIEELQNERPTDLFYETWFGDFIKATSFVIPEFSEDIHHEIEIIIKIRWEIHRA